MLVVQGKTGVSSGALSAISWCWTFMAVIVAMLSTGDAGWVGVVLALIVLSLFFAHLANLARKDEW